MKNITTPKTTKSKRIFSLAVFVLLLSTMFIYSCRKDGNNSSLNTSSTNETGSFQLSENVNASIEGIVLLENGDPAADALVKIGNTSTATNEDGKFVLEQVTAPKDHAHLIVEVDGFFISHKTIRLTENVRSYTRIRLLKKELTQTFKSNELSTVRVTGGGRIIFQENSLMNKATEEVYNGSVNVYSKYIDPTSDVIDEMTPGCLRGISTTNTEEYIQTYGMFAVELYDDSGNPLQLQKGKTAEIRFPIPPAALAKAPDNMPSWSLDETIGLWREEGTLTKAGNEYTGQASHFSFWNADQPGLVNFSVEFRDHNNNPLANYAVKLTDQNNSFITRTGYTNGQGIASGGVYPNTQYNVELIYFCGGSNNKTTVYSTSASVAGVALNLGVQQVTLNSVSTASVAGTIVNTTNSPIPFAKIKIKPAGSSVTPNIVVSDAQGNFTYSIPMCVNSMVLDVHAYDTVNGTNSGILQYTIAPGNQNIGNINASIENNEFIRFVTVSWGAPVEYIITEPNASFTCTYQNNQYVINCFTTLPGQNWSAKFKIDGPVGVLGVGQHTLPDYEDKFGIYESWFWNLIPNAQVNMKKNPTTRGKVVTGTFKTTYGSPQQNNYRNVFFNVRRDN